MKRERLDPVDLMLLGRMDEAAKVYLDLYVKMVEEGDRSLTYSHNCTSAWQARVRNLGTSPKV